MNKYDAVESTLATSKQPPEKRRASAAGEHEPHDSQLRRRSFALLLIPVFPSLAGFRMTNSIADLKPDDFFESAQLALVTAAINGDPAMVQKALKAGASPNEPGHYSIAPLAYAVSTANATAITHLMRAGADPGLVVEGVGSPAGLAITEHAKSGNTMALTALLDGGMSPDLFSDSRTPLVISALITNHRPAVQLLLDRGANINLQGTHGETLLGTTLPARAFDLAKKLLNAGARIDLKNPAGWDFPAQLQSRLNKVPEDSPERRQLLEIRSMLEAKGVKFPYPLPARPSIAR